MELTRQGELNRLDFVLFKVVLVLDDGDTDKILSMAFLSNKKGINNPDNHFAANIASVSSTSLTRLGAKKSHRGSLFSFISE